MGHSWTMKSLGSKTRLTFHSTTFLFFAMGASVGCHSTLHVGRTNDAGTGGSLGTGGFGTGGAGGTVVPDGGAGGFGGMAGAGGMAGSYGGNAGGSASACWWQGPPGSVGGASGASVAVQDGWPPSPTRIAGPAISRTRVDAWTTLSNTGAPSGPRTGATAVWTGSEMIVWGGFTSQPESTGGRYDPATDSWLSLSASVAPKARQYHVAVWTGSEMIVWGGFDGASYLVSGGRYDPASDQWTAMSLNGAPTLAADPRGVWTGTELIVWPGQIASTATVGARYDPKTDTWKQISPTGAPTLQYSSVVWTGTTMIVWGGYSNSAGCDSATGAIYDPSTDTWRPTTTVGAPHPRDDHAAVWTGAQMIVWGEINSTNAGSYDPVADAWYAIAQTDAPSPREIPALFFLPDQGGTAGAGRMLLWGGSFGYSYVPVTGAIYDFVPDEWGVVASFPNPPDNPNQDSARTTVWTGTQMIVWDVAAGLGAKYSP